MQATLPPPHPPRVYVFIRAVMEADAMDAGLALVLFLLQRATRAHQAVLATSKFLLQICTERLEGNGQPSAQLQLDWLKLRRQLIGWRPGECPSNIVFPVLSETARRR